MFEVFFPGLTGKNSLVMWKWWCRFCVRDHEIGFAWSFKHISPFCPFL